MPPVVTAHRAHVEWRALRNKVENDPVLRTARAKAESARTDSEKRELLRRYYVLYYDRIIAIAPADAKAYVANRKNQALATLAQPRVRPTPTPEAPYSSQTRRR